MKKKNQKTFVSKLYFALLPFVPFDARNKKGIKIRKSTRAMPRQESERWKVECCK